MDKVNIIPKNEFAKLLAVLVFNLEELYPGTREWNAVKEVTKILLECIHQEDINSDKMPQIDDTKKLMNRFSQDLTVALQENVEKALAHIKKQYEIC